ncbi:MAG: NAD(P)/FAD-dependent oxidoreductase [Bryobacteraceae bacterium]|nr:NAD(P)/FAD-dependent oxidoreductase [Bryobacteraceae bacterium]
MEKPEVLVSGAGPVGLFAAHSLARAGVSVQVVDTGIWGCAHSYALALHPSTVDLLHRSGIAVDTSDDRYAVRTLALYDRKVRRAEIRLDQPSGKPMLILPQSLLESQLEKALTEAGVKVQWRHKVMNLDPQEDHVNVALNRYEKESFGYVVSRSDWVVAKSWTENVPYVVGADGYASAVRRSLGFSFPEVGPCAWYGVFEFNSSADIEEEVRVVLGERTSDVLWPLGDGWFRWSFELPDFHNAEDDRLAKYRQRFGEPTDRVKDRIDSTTGDVNTLPDRLLKELILERAPWFEGSVDEIGWRTAVRFERRLSSGFGRDRCWILGDAAHLAGPIGVQSLNVGLTEAADLGQAIAKALRGSGGSTELQAWENRYMTEWRRLQGIDGTIEPMPCVDPWIWQNHARILPALPAHGADLSSLAGQIGITV